MKRLLLNISVLLAACAACLFCPAVAEGASWQHIDQLGSIPVSRVVVDPADHLEVAAIAGGDVWLSHDGGLTWSDHPFPAGLPTSVAFDPVHKGRIAIGTYNTCLQESDDGGITWRQYRVPFNYYCNVQEVIGTKDGFVFDMQQVIGYTTHLFRLADAGISTISTFSDIHPGALGYDEEKDELCVGTTQELYCSFDDELSWQRVALPNQIGNSPHDILVQDDEAWLVSDKGVLHFTQGSWVAAVPNNPAISGSPYSGLVVNGQSILFGANTDGGGDVDEQTSFGPQGTGLNLHVYDLAAAQDTLFAASSHGLYINHGLTQSQAMIRRPVIVLPGITGSLPGPKNLGALSLDPVLHTYDPLIARLKAVGYEEGKTLFPFPYNWEVGNEYTAQLLKEQIAQAKAVCGCGKVDVVAHSMGGLVSRSYIEGSDYADDINKLIEVGTPNAGSVDSYYTWEGGEVYASNFFSRASANLESGIFHLQAFSKGYTNFTRYIHDHVQSVRELLPIFDYIRGRSYPDGYPSNPFLEQLDTPAAQALVSRRVKLRIIGGDTLDTLRWLQLKQAGDSSYSYPDGRVSAVEYAPGDGTVPVSSLSSLAKPDTYVNASHGQLTTVAQDQIIRYLLEDDADQSYLNSVPNELDKQASVVKAEQLAAAENYQMLYVSGGSGSLEVTDDQHQSIGTNVDTGSYASGDLDGSQMVTIPNPSSGFYEFHFIYDTSAQSSANFVFGGSSLDSSLSADAEQPAGQASVSLQPGDEVLLDYDTASQEVTIKEVRHKKSEHRAIDVSHQDGEGGTSFAPQDATWTKEASSPVVASLVQTSISKAPPLFDGSPSSSAIFPSPAGDVSTQANTIPVLRHTVGASAILLSKEWKDFGTDFWLSFAVIFLLMLALVLWRTAKKF